MRISDWSSDVCSSDLDIARFETLLAQAARPIFIVGGSRWTPEARDALIAFAERLDVPVAAAFRRAALFPATNAQFVGDLGIGPNPALADSVARSELVVLIGWRMSGIASHSSPPFALPPPAHPLVHAHPH